MRKLIVFISVVLTTIVGKAQSTDLDPGDIIFIGYNSIASNQAAPNYMAFLARKAIDAGTVIYITNQKWSSSASAFSSGTKSNHGTIKLEFNEAILIGQPFEIIFSTSGNMLKSTKGVVGYDAGSKFEFSSSSDYNELFVYQVTPNISYLTALVWDNKVPTNYPTGLDFSSSASKNAVITGFNGQNAKCGVWTPAIMGTNFSFSSPLNLTFYNSIGTNWEYETGNNVSVNASGYCPCNPDSIYSTINNIYAIVEANIVYDKYLYQTNGVWKEYNGSTWSTLGGTGVPDWDVNTASKEIILHKNYELGSPAQPFTTKTFECAKLTIEDSDTALQKQDGVSLMVHPGNKLLIRISLDFIDSYGAIRPKIHLKSAKNGADVSYAMLAPTGANLGDVHGDFRYDLYIRNPGWHHFQSPISQQFSDINSGGITPQTADGATTTFSFIGGPVGTGNFFKWNAATSQWVQASTSDNFSSEPYTVYFELTDIPCVLSVSGPLAYSDMDEIKYKQALYHNPSVSTSQNYGNVPGWAGDGSDGWNFYGNPFISALSTESLFAKHAGAIGQSGSKMDSLDNKVYIWQPDGLLSNLTGNYRYKTYLSGTHGGLAAAQYLPPFQAFFMRNSTGLNAKKKGGFLVSNQYITNSTLTSSNSIQNKTSIDFSGPKSLMLTKSFTGENATIQVVPYGRERLKYPVADIMSSPNKETAFCLAVDSTIYDIKFWPIPAEDTSSIPVLVSHPTPGETFKLSSSDPNTFLLDKALNVLHSFQQGEYTFTHQTAYNASPRFTWIFAGNATVGLEEELWQPEPVVVSYGEGWVKFSYSDDVDFTLVDMQGKTLETGRFQNGEYTLETSSMPAGLYTIMSNAFSSKFIVR